MKLQPTPEEHSAGQLSPENLRLAAQGIATDGYVILEDVLSADFMAELRTKFVQTFDKFVARTDPNRGKNRFQMHLPFMTPFNDPRIITNPFIMQLLDHVLGSNPVCHYFASDTPLPGSDYQDVHADIHLLFPETQLALPAYSVVLNIPLVDFTEENGPLEIWPGGTHLFGGGIEMKKLAAQMTSIKVKMTAGSILLRDMRMWHRGTPNRSTMARPNIALIYSRHWLKTDYPAIGIPRSTYDALSTRAQSLFRKENIGGPLDNDPSA